MKVTLYIATQNKTGLKYFGKTLKYSTEDTLQKYYHGSGLYWRRHLNIHGDDVTMEIYGIYDINKVKEVALNFSEENNIVESKEWANLISESGVGSLHLIDTCTKISETKLRNFKEGKLTITRTKEQKDKMSIIMKEHYKRNGHHLKGSSYEKRMGKEKADKLKSERRKNSSKPVEIDGRNYESLESACIGEKLSLYKLNQLIHNEKTKRTFIFEGVEYKDKKSCCEILGIGRYVLNGMLNNSQNIRSFTLNGVRYGNKQEAMKILGISNYKLNKLIKEEDDNMGNIRT